MNEKRDRTILTISIIVVVGVLISLIGGCLGGGLAGYLLASGRDTDLEERVAKLEDTGILELEANIPELRDLLQELPDLMEELQALQDFDLFRFFEQPEITPPSDEETFPFFWMPGMPDIGAWVEEVIEGSPAEEAGLMVDDVILAVDGVEVDATHALEALIGAHEPGDRVELTIQREGEETTITARLGAHPDDASKAYLGVYFVPLATEWEFEMDLTPDQPSG